MKTSLFMSCRGNGWTPYLCFRFVSTCSTIYTSQKHTCTSLAPKSTLTLSRDRHQHYDHPTQPNSPSGSPSSSTAKTAHKSNLPPGSPAKASNQYFRSKHRKITSRKACTNILYPSKQMSLLCLTITLHSRIFS